MLRLQKMRSVTFDYGNNIRTFAFQRGVKNAYDFPGFVPAYIRPLFCEGRGPFRWVALSGEPSDIHVTDDLVLELFPENRILRRWIDLARKRIRFQGLPARICWLGYGERAQFGLAINELVKKGKIKAPIVSGRDHLDCGSVAYPFRETECMKDGSDAVADVGDGAGQRPEERWSEWRGDARVSKRSVVLRRSLLNYLTGHVFYQI